MSEPSFASLERVAGLVSRETFDGLTAFVGRFKQWNARINLTSASQDDLWARHVLDSAQLLPLSRKATQWLDLGSGGGFPGLIVAFLLKGADGRVDLVESNRKKAGFLQTMIGEFDLPATVHAVRIADAAAKLPTPQIVTARALASLDVLFDYSSTWLAGGAKGFFHKGRDYRHEIEESSRNWRFDLVEHRSVIDENSVILEISNLERR